MDGSRTKMGVISAAELKAQAVLIRVTWFLFEPLSISYTAKNIMLLPLSFTKNLRDSCNMVLSIKSGIILRITFCLSRMLRHH